MFPTSHGATESFLEGDAVTLDRLQPVRQLSVNSARILYKEVGSMSCRNRSRTMTRGKESARRLLKVIPPGLGVLEGRLGQLQYKDRLSLKRLSSRWAS